MDDKWADLHCETCFWFQTNDLEQDPFGHCRRMPVKVEELLGHVDFCGEHCFVPAQAKRKKVYCIDCVRGKPAKTTLIDEELANSVLSDWESHIETISRGSSPTIDVTRHLCPTCIEKRKGA